MGKMSDFALDLEEAMRERLSGIETQLRNMNSLCGEFFLKYTLEKTPIQMKSVSYRITISKVKDGKWSPIHRDEGMELEILLKKTNKWLELYRNEHKDYGLTKYL